ncbi:MAG: ABC transporter ATP-binding protein [Spirochaetales bacterium]|nr:ABC transporter ATP-binding protein [Spirochaetales bacterium]
MIDVAGFSKRYGDFEAVRDVSFVVEPGRVTGLLGPNGAGKTSVMRAIAGCHEPGSGSIRVGGIDVVEDPRRAKAILGYLPENAPLWPDPTPAELLRFVADARGLARPAAAIGRVASDCGLEDVMRVPVGKLSKGFRQRVALALALVHDPEVLVLDEPTSGLDPNQAIEIRSMIEELGRSRTVLLSTHVLNEAEALCATVLIMAGGSIVARGAAGEIARGLKGEERIELLLKGADVDRARSLAARLAPRISCVGSVASDDGVRLAFAVADDGGSDAAEAAFDWALANGLKILELKRERLSLEDIFVSLTRGEKER